MRSRNAVGMSAASLRAWAERADGVRVPRGVISCGAGCCRLGAQGLAEDDEVVAGRVEIVDDGLVPVAAGFVEPPRRFVGRRSRSLHEDEAALLRRNDVLHVLQQRAAYALPSRVGIHGNPVQIPDALGQGMGAKACVAQGSAAVVKGEKGVAASLALF